MQIAHAGLEDARAVADIHVRAWQVAYASILPPEYLASLSVEQREAEWRQCIAAGEPELLVAKDATAVYGWVCFGSSRDEGVPDTEAEVWAIYTAPPSWSIGVGRTLWVHAKDRMRERGFKSCGLWVFPQNDRAIRFYQAAGFHIQASSLRSFELVGLQLEEVKYVCALDG